VIMDIGRGEKARSAEKIVFPGRSVIGNSREAQAPPPVSRDRVRARSPGSAFRGAMSSMLSVSLFGLELFQIANGAKFQSAQSQAPSRRSLHQCRILIHHQTGRKHTSARYAEIPASNDPDRIRSGSQNTGRSGERPTGKPEQSHLWLCLFLRFADHALLAGRQPKPADKGAGIRG
jgi:hypothetical protein